MYSVLLVDDETIILQGLKLGFDWASHDCTVVGEATNGIEALKKVRELNPDIVITDIHMPKYDGIDFMKALKASNINIQIVVLSGYDNFMYAKEAIDAGAFTYLLKPVNLDVLSETIEKLKERIEKNRKLINDEIAYNSIKAEELILDIIANPKKTNEILEKNPTFFRNTSGNYFVAFISVDDIDSLTKSLLKVSQTLRECINNTMQKLGNQSIKIQFTQTQYIIVFFLNDSSSYDKIADMLSQLLKNFHDNCNATASIGISGIFRNLKLISTAYHQAEFALNSKSVYGKNTIIDYIKISNAKTNKFYMNSNDIENFSELIRQQDYDNIKNKLQKYFDVIMNENNFTINVVKNNITEIAILMLNAFASNSDLLYLMFGRSVNPEKEISPLNRVEEIQHWIFNVLDTLSSTNNLFGKNITNENVKQAILYIAANYNKKLTIESVASKLYISSRQLMRCFKQETGLTFNDYLTNYRIQKAIRLFETKKYAIYEVAQMVGYNDSRHFCKLFKRISGKNPGEIK